MNSFAPFDRLTDEQLRAQTSSAVQIVAALGACIKDSGSNGIPSGWLYAGLCDRLTYVHYKAAIGVLKRTKLVIETPHHLLIWKEYMK